MRAVLLSASLVALMLGGAGCSYSNAIVPVSSSTNTNVPSPSAAFDAPVTLTIGEHVTFSDGTGLKLTAINDSRCPAKVQCIWAGELAPVFIFYGVDQTTQGFTLGTVRAAQVTVQNHLIILKDATTKQVTVTVSKK